MQLQRRFPLVLFAAFFLASLTANAAVTLPRIIGDHMVIQADMKAPIWGKAAPGERVTVKCCCDELTAVADVDGKWMVRLPRHKAGETLELSIRGKDSAIDIKDVLVGEVWVGSGQSNMQWAVKDSTNAEKEIADADYPKMRLFYVERVSSQIPQWDCKGEWLVCTPENIPMFSAVLYFFGRDLHKTLNKPVGLIHTSWGGTPAESWTSRAALEANPDLAHLVKKFDALIDKYPQAKKEYDVQFAEWQKQADRAKADGKDAPKKPAEPRGPDHPWCVSGLYNAMINPLLPYGIKGAIWYQGESNADRAYQYRNLFPAMIKDWRKAWGQGNFPFYWVQLANFMEPDTEPVECAWAELREAQNITLSLPNTGTAVIIDIGDAKDIHPKNKQDVGKRLALNALAKDYGMPVIYSGPMFKSARFKNGKAVVKFKHGLGLNARGGEPRGFAVAGADRKFYWAKAEIKDDKIIAWSEKVPEPVAVRYGWSNNPPCNLYNGAGLPASPFRSDNWPGLTADKK